jgi:hypothetical protein
LKWAYAADVVLMLVVILLWTGVGVSFGWTTSRWQPEHWFGRWVLAAIGTLTNWLFLCLFAYAHSRTWDENLGESRAPQNLQDIFSGLFDTEVAYWWTVAWTVLFVAAAVVRQRSVIMLGIGLSLAAWMVIGWWGFVQACHGFG